MPRPYRSQLEEHTVSPEPPTALSPLPASALATLADASTLPLPSAANHYSVLAPDGYTPTLQTVLYRCFGYRHRKSGDWRIHIQGRRAYDLPIQLNLAKRLMLRGLVKRMKLPETELRSINFRDRVAGFLVDAEAGHRVKLEVADQIFSIRRRTRKSGLFQGKLDIPAGTFANHAVHGHQIRDGIIPVLRTHDKFPPAAAECLLADTFGINVVSDIDDTLKHTEVDSRQQMLRRTFLDPFVPIEGMSQIFQQWAEELPVLFQYVSSSPWQLYGPLRSFLDDFQFPLGSIHLQWFNLRDELLKKWKLARRRGKAAVIRSLIKRMPYRKFVLLGDSGERDPEIYAELAEMFPKNVLGIAIRELDSRPITTLRTAQLRSQVNGIPICIFKEPAEIAQLLAHWYRP